MNHPNFDIRPRAENRDILPGWVRVFPYLFLVAAFGALVGVALIQKRVREERAATLLVEKERAELNRQILAENAVIATLTERIESARAKALWCSAVFQTSPYLHAILVSERALDDRLDMPGDEAARFSDEAARQVRVTQLAFSDISPDGEGFSMSLRGAQLSGSAGRQVGKAWFQLLAKNAISDGYEVHKVNSPEDTASEWAFSTTFKKEIQ